MFDYIKACVKHNNKTLAYFPMPMWSETRREHAPPPLLFAIYFNELETSLLASGSEGINLEFKNEDTLCYLKLTILLIQF